MRILKGAVIFLVAGFLIAGLGASNAYAQRSTPVTVINGESTPVPVSVVNGAVPGSVQYRVVGATGDPARYGGDSALYNLNRYCREQFNNQARMCTSEEVMKTPDLISLQGRNGWVQPVVGSAVVLPSGELEVVDSASGLHSATLNCDNWSADSGRGLMWEASHFSAVLCTNSLRVVCCGPTLVSPP